MCNCKGKVNRQASEQATQLQAAREAARQEALSKKTLVQAAPPPQPKLNPPKP